jgi:hypothetical protein
MCFCSPFIESAISTGLEAAVDPKILIIVKT